MKITNFSDIVTRHSLGALSHSKLGFYTRRLAKETSTRRLASALMLALLVFQFFTFVSPPQSSKASQSANNIIFNGITDTSNQGVLNAFKNTGAIQLLYQVGISDQDILSGSQGASFCKSQIPNMVSMGRQNSAGSWLYPGHNDIYLGSPNSRWLQDCFGGLKGTNKIFADIGQGGPQWYEWGLLYDCGNLVFIPTSPPPPPPVPEKTVACTSLSANPLTAQANQPITLTGVATGTDLPAGELVNMSYLVFKGTNISVNTTPLFARLDSAGIEYNAANQFIDNSKQFSTAESGTYTVLLAVGYDGGDKLAPGSGIGNCLTNITIQPRPEEPSIVCENLGVTPATAAAGTAISMTGTARLRNSTAAEPADFAYYIRERRADGTFDDTTVDARGRHEINSAFIAHTNGLYTDTRPPQVDPNGTFVMPANTSTSPKTYQIFLRVFWRGHVAVSDAFSVPACAKLVTVPPQPAKQFICENLIAQPVTGAAPLEVSFTAKGAASNTPITSWNLDFGDSTKTNTPTDRNTITANHTYEKGGTYTAIANMVTQDGTTPDVASCRVQIRVGDSEFVKVVANVTLLTDDGKPTDANGAVARAGDTLKYTIGIQNKGAEIKGFVFEDDISDILFYAEITDLGGAELVRNGNNAKLVWPAIDIPAASTSGEAQVTTKQFSVKLKDPIPEIAQKTTDLPTASNCELENTFKDAAVATPLGVSLNKQIECTTKKLPQTGAGLPIFFVAFFAASSAFLFFRNRLLKRELELVETLSQPEGETHV